MAGRASSGNSASKVDPITWVIFPVAGIVQILSRAFVRSCVRVVYKGGEIVRILPKRASTGYGKRADESIAADSADLPRDFSVRADPGEGGFAPCRGGGIADADPARIAGQVAV